MYTEFHYLFWLFLLFFREKAKFFVSIWKNDLLYILSPEKYLSILHHVESSKWNILLMQREYNIYINTDDFKFSYII